MDDQDPNGADDLMASVCSKYLDMLHTTPTIFYQKELCLNFIILYNSEQKVIAAIFSLTKFELLMPCISIL